MKEQVDPSLAIPGFQSALDKGTLERLPCQFHTHLWRVLDSAGGWRMTYMDVADGKIRSMFMVVRNGFLDDGSPVFAIGYATTPENRRQGIGKKLARESTEELVGALKAIGTKRFAIEARIHRENIPSQIIARDVLGVEPQPFTDEKTGHDSLIYEMIVDQN